MKHIATFFDDPEYHDYPFDSGNYYEDSYIELGLILERKGARAYIVRDQQTYLGNNIFDGGWVFDDGDFKRTEERITADLIYDKGHFQPDAQAKTLNVKEFDDICTDKYNTYKAFPELFVPTYLARDEEELCTAIENIASHKAVTKPVSDEGGNGILVGDPEELKDRMRRFPCIVQEFMDTSQGIPGLVDGLHDFRMVTFQGEIVGANIRQPKPGSYLANIAKGGSIFDVALEKIPQEARGIFEKVDTILARFPKRHYALDVCRRANGDWKMIELNARPGLPERTEMGFSVFMERLSDLLIQN